MQNVGVLKPLSNMGWLWLRNVKMNVIIFVCLLWIACHFVSLGALKMYNIELVLLIKKILFGILKFKV